MRVPVSDRAVICSSCGLLLDVTEFHRNRVEKTGYTRICRRCRSVPVHAKAAAAMEPA